jgi:hypothetical protein
VSTPEPPQPTPDEEDASLERRRDEEAQRGPGHDDPEEAVEPDTSDA